MIKGKIFSLVATLILGPVFKGSFFPCQETLAPPPLIGGVQGVPSHETIYDESSDTHYDIFWDGKKLHPPTKLEPHQDMNVGMIFFMVVAGICTWIWIISKVWGWFW